LLDDIRIAGVVVTPPPCVVIEPQAVFVGVGKVATVSVTVDTKALEGTGRTIVLGSPRPDLFEIVGADTFGEIALEFPADALSTTLTFDVTGVGGGSAAVAVVDSDGLCVDGTATINVSGAFVTNPSFDATPAPGGVGYGVIPGWTGGSGINNGAQPFADNGIIPDRGQVAFLQGPQTMSQEVSGLEAGTNYWLQFLYNVRDCCGGTIDLSVFFDGDELATYPAIEPVGSGFPYHLAHLEFTAPAGGGGVLEFITTASGDATVVIDAVSIVRRDPGEVAVVNPSFEATLPPLGVGYVSPAGVAGWDMTQGELSNWGINIDGAGPFTDNGIAEDGEGVLLLQNNATASQTLAGLTPGTTYTLHYAVNARNC
jgi:hypothetical protein